MYNSRSTRITPETSTQPDRQIDETTNDMVYGTTFMDHLVSTSTPIENIQTFRDHRETSTFIERESSSTETTVVLSTTNECRFHSDFQTLTIKFENLPSTYSELRKFKNIQNNTQHCVAYQNFN